MTHDHVVALGMVESWEAPGILEGDEMRLLGVVVEVDGPEASDLLSRHLRPIDSFLERRGEHCSQDEPNEEHGGPQAAILQVVQIRKKPRYRRCSNSAMMQSTMCGFGVRM